MADLLMGTFTDHEGKRKKIELAVDEFGRLKTVGEGESMSAMEIKAGLEGLSGDERLPVDAIKGAAKVVNTPAGPVLVDSSAGGQYQIINSLTIAEFKTLSPATYSGRLVFVTDFGEGGSFWRSTGVVWKLTQAVTLKTLLTPVNTPSTSTDPHVQMEYLLPGGMWPVGAKVRVEPVWIFPTYGDASPGKRTQVLIGGGAAFTKVQGDLGLQNYSLSNPLVDLVRIGDTNELYMPYSHTNGYQIGTNALQSNFFRDLSADIAITVRAAWEGVFDPVKNITLKSCKIRMIP